MARDRKQTKRLYELNQTRQSSKETKVVFTQKGLLDFRTKGKQRMSSEKEVIGLQRKEFIVIRQNKKTLHFQVKVFPGEIERIMSLRKERG